MTKWSYIGLVILLGPIRGWATQAGEASQRSVQITEVMYKYAAPRGLRSIREVDFKNLPVVIFDTSGHPWERFPLRNGTLERQTGLEIDEVNLGEIYYFQGPHDATERALLELEWLSEAGSSSNRTYLQVFEIRGGDLFATQQIAYDMQAPGTLDRFYSNTRSLVVLARTADDSPHCCPKSLTQVTFDWNGREFHVRNIQELFLRCAASPQGRDSAARGGAFWGGINAPLGLRFSSISVITVGV